MLGFKRRPPADEQSAKPLQAKTDEAAARLAELAAAKGRLADLAAGMRTATGGVKATLVHQLEELDAEIQRLNPDKE